MDFKLLERIAKSPEAVVLHDGNDVSSFFALLENNLITGWVYTDATGERYATATGLRPDGRAVLALIHYQEDHAGAPRIRSRSPTPA
jgi:hypothetical protein